MCDSLGHFFVGALVFRMVSDASSEFRVFLVR